MRMLAPLAVSALALSVGACSASPKTAVATGRLDCPTTSGDLTRLSSSADGKTCIYKERDGAEVTLKLVALQGGLDATLASLEAELMKDAGGPEAAGPATDAPQGGASADLPPPPPAPPAPPAPGAALDAARTAEDAARDAKVEIRDGQSKATISGSIGDHKVEIQGDSDKEEAHINLPGLHIDAKGDAANVQVGPMHISANDDNATIRMRKDVRLRGEPLALERRGIRATFVYVNHDKAGAYSFVGYEASGRRAGPIVVALVKAKGDEKHKNSDMYDDVKRLVRKNGGA